MLCKNCGKEIPDEAKFCDGCGVQKETANGQINISEFQAAMNNSSNVTVATKKKVSTKKVILIVCGLFFLAFCIYAMTMDSDSENVIKSNSPSGASFNLSIDDVINQYNQCVEKNMKNSLNWTNEEFETAKPSFILSKEYFSKENDSSGCIKYFCASSNNSYGITIGVDDSENVYYVQIALSEQAITGESGQAFMILLYSLNQSVETSKSMENIQEIFSKVCSTSVIKQDNIKYVVQEEDTCIRYSVMAEIS